MRRRYIISVVAMMLLPLMAGAQALKGSYFLDNSLQRHRLNPAFAPRANYFSVPVISNVGLGLYGNVGPADFLYPKNGELYTFLNRNVTMEEFSKNLPARPLVDLDVDTDIFNFGFSALGGFWTVDAGIRVDGQIGLPRDFLIFAKQGMAASEQRYSLNGFEMFQTSSVYAAVGHSRDLSDLVKGLRVGAKLRFFLPFEHIGLTMGDSYLSMNQDKWTVNSSASGVVAASFLKVNPEALGGDSEQEFLEMNTSDLGLAGFGLALDLGAEYRLDIGSVVDGLTFSLSALDLGGYFFGKNSLQGLESKGTAVYEGLKDIEMGGGEGVNLEESLDALQDEFLALANLQESSNPMYTSVGTGAKIFAGVEYPFLQEKMSVGLLYSGKFGYSKMINDLTVSYNLNPCKWFNFGLNWSFLNSYKTMGWIVEFSPKAGVDFFIGSDYTFFEVMPKIFLPVDKLWVNARFGLSFMIGGKN
ncbi:MAG: hypothetical protein E7113_06465 [Bacteroidales bacterium]|nr:hypothetical protein [Bacteroidales bacterium]